MLRLMLAVLCAAVSLANSSPLQLKKLILISRHGIRTPFPSVNIGQPSYSAYSKDNRPWPENPPDWGAAGMEHLTDHGMRVLQRMGEYYSLTLPFSVSPDNSTVYSDIDSSSRDLQTAQNFLKGLGLAVPILQNASCTDWLLNQGRLPPSPQCVLPSEPMVQSTVGGSIQEYTAQYRQSVMALNDAVGCCGPSVCPNATAGAPCTLMDIPAKFNPVAFWSLYSGPLATGAALSEFLQLAYLNNMSTDTVAPGLGQYEISKLAGVHSRSLRLTDSNLVVARAFGSQLMDHISRTIGQLTGGADPSLRSSSTDNLVYYAAHDINLYFIRSLLRLDWQTESYDDNMAPPGAMIGFELLQAADDQTWYVKLYLTTQSMNQMRFASPLNSTHPPARAPLIIPECYGGPELSCAVQDFQKLADKVVRPECVRVLQC